MRLQYQITVSFLPFMMFVCITFGLLQFAVLYQGKINATREFLRATAVLQSNRVREGLAQQESILGSLTSRTKLRRSMAEWGDVGNTESRASAERILRDAVTGTPSVLAVHALDPLGHVIASTTNIEAGTLFELPELINDFGFKDLGGLSANKLPMFGHRPDGRLIQLMMGPAVLDDLIVGYLVAEVVPVFITGFAQDYEGMGQTGETMIGQRNAAGHAVFLGPQRFPEQAITGRLVRADKQYVPILHAVNGVQTFFTSAPDYRGEQVLAVTREIPGFELGVVAKIDRSEVLEPVFEAGLLTIISLIIVFFVLLMISRVLARSISRPIEELTARAEAVLKKRQIWTPKNELQSEFSILTVTMNSLLDSLFRAEQGLSEERISRTPQPPHDAETAKR